MRTYYAVELPKQLYKKINYSIVMHTMLKHR